MKCSCPLGGICPNPNREEEKFGGDENERWPTCISSSFSCKITISTSQEGKKLISTSNILYKTSEHDRQGLCLSFVSLCFAFYSSCVSLWNPMWSQHSHAFITLSLVKCRAQSGWAMISSASRCRAVQPGPSLLYMHQDETCSDSRFAPTVHYHRLAVKSLINLHLKCSSMHSQFGWNLSFIFNKFYWELFMTKSPWKTR